MRLLLLITFWSLLLYSCKEVTFQDTQPSGIPSLKELPFALRGVYQTYDDYSGKSAPLIPGMV